MACVHKLLQKRYHKFCIDIQITNQIVWNVIESSRRQEHPSLSQKQAKYHYTTLVVEICNIFNNFCSRGWYEIRVWYGIKLECDMDFTLFSYHTVQTKSWCNSDTTLSTCVRWEKGFISFSASNPYHTWASLSCDMDCYPRMIWKLFSYHTRWSVWYLLICNVFLIHHLSSHIFKIFTQLA